MYFCYNVWHKILSYCDKIHYLQRVNKWFNSLIKTILKSKRIIRIDDVLICNNIKFNNILKYISDVKHIRLNYIRDTVYLNKLSGLYIEVSNSLVFCNKISANYIHLNNCDIRYDKQIFIHNTNCVYLEHVYNCDRSLTMEMYNINKLVLRKKNNILCSINITTQNVKDVIYL